MLDYHIHTAKQMIEQPAKCRDACHCTAMAQAPAETIETNAGKGCVMAAGQVEVEQARICYGGVAPKCVMATNAQAALEGQPWNQATLDAALLAVAKDINITPDAPGIPDVVL